MKMKCIIWNWKVAGILETTIIKSLISNKLRYVRNEIQFEIIEIRDLKYQKSMMIIVIMILIVMTMIIYIYYGRVHFG
jgi:hypothetical protein